MRLLSSKNQMARIHKKCHKSFENHIYFYRGQSGQSVKKEKICLDPKHISSSVNHNKDNVMTWVCMSDSGLFSLIFVNDSNRINLRNRTTGSPCSQTNAQFVCGCLRWVSRIALASLPALYRGLQLEHSPLAHPLRHSVGCEPCAYPVNRRTGQISQIVLRIVTHKDKTANVWIQTMKQSFFTSSWLFLRYVSSSFNPDSWICRSFVANLVSPRRARRRVRSASTSKHMFLSVSNLHHQITNRDWDLICNK